MERDASELARLAEETACVYERQAAVFDRQRPRGLHEQGWLERFAALLPAGGSVLDVGCGAAEPFPAWFMGRGFRVTGVDVATTMLALARARFPDGDWRHADMRRLRLGERFDGILGWHSFFHLTREEQRATLPRLVGHLAPHGALMLTVGPSEGEAIGRVGDEPVHHASLDPEEYERILTDLGLGIVRFVAEDPTCGGSTILLARKRPAPGRARE